MDGETTWLSAAFIIIAIVYAAVGQAGTSGYIAVMGLASFAPLAMKTTALSLNLVGAALFLKAGAESHGGMSGHLRFLSFPSP